ncbi:hypothetical protein ACJX0J_029491 [Zea mays]
MTPLQELIIGEERIRDAVKECFALFCFQTANKTYLSLSNMHAHALGTGTNSGTAILQGGDDGDFHVDIFSNGLTTTETHHAKGGRDDIVALGLRYFQGKLDIKELIDSEDNLMLKRNTLDLALIEHKVHTVAETEVVK